MRLRRLGKREKMVTTRPDFALATGATCHHFSDLGKMVGDPADPEHTPPGPGRVLSEKGVQEHE